MSTKRTPKKETKSAPKKRVKPRHSGTMADYLEPIEPASPTGDPGVEHRPVTGTSSLGPVPGATGFSGAPNGVGVFGMVGAAPSAFILPIPGYGVRGEGPIGVSGTSSTGGHAAVFGEHTGAGVGVLGDVAKDGVGTAGVLGRHKGPDGTGVRGEGKTGVVGEGTFIGVRGHSNGQTGIKGEGGPIGVLGQGKVVGVSGICTDSAAGISGPGVRGVGNYGGQFQGMSAQLHLRPVTGVVGRPTTGQHKKGEIFLDQEGTLFVCVADGTPGTWRRVMTEPA
jgi:hypothetical protein